MEILYKNMEGEKILSKVHFHYSPDVSTVIRTSLIVWLDVQVVLSGRGSGCGVS